MSWSRRRALTTAAGCVGTLWLPGCRRSDVPLEDRCPQAYERLSTELVDAFTPLVDLLRSGISEADLYGAALRLGCEVVPPHIDQHDVLIVRASQLLGQRTSPQSRLLPLFATWERHVQLNVDALTSGAEQLAPVISALKPAPERAEAALTEACEAWDAEAAAAAADVLYETGGIAALRGPLSRYGIRNHDWVGHVAIGAAFTLRDLDGLECGASVVQSMARSVTFRDNSSTAAFYANVTRLPEVPAGWRNGADRPDDVPDLVEVFRTGDADACVEEVLRQLADGTSPRTLWTALALHAVDIGVRWREASFGVHDLDTVNALRQLANLSPDPDTQALCLLQAAAWQSEFLAFVNDDPPDLDETLFDLAPEQGTPTLTEVFESFSGDVTDASRTMKAWFAAEGDPSELMTTWADELVRHWAGDQHWTKFTAALFEEADAVLPEWRPTLLLGLPLRTATLDTAPWERLDEALQAIATL